MAVLPNMGLVTPQLKGDSGTWDSKVNANFVALDAHNHTTGKGPKVPSAGLNINADLSFGGFTVTSLGKIAFSAIAAPSTGSKNLFVSSADNELYWRSNAGVNVKLTAGASINTALVGGIVGDYAAVGAALAYDDTNKQYTFKDQSAPTKKWVRLASGPVRIYEHQTTESVYIEHATAAALAVSYTVTWPAALPGAAALVQISAAGLVSYSATLPANTVIKHASQSIRTPCLVANALKTAGAGTVSSASSGDLPYTLVGASTTAVVTLPILRTGDRVTSVVITISGGAGVPTFAVGTLTGSSFLAVASSVAINVLDYTLTVTTPAALTSNDSLMIQMAVNAAGSQGIYSILVNYDRP